MPVRLDARGRRRYGHSTCASTITRSSEVVLMKIAKQLGAAARVSRDLHATVRQPAPTICVLLTAVLYLACC